MESDTHLLDRWIRQHDPAAFTVLAERHAGMVYATCRQITGDHHAAEDLAQEVLLDLARKARGIRRSVAGFLYATARSRALNRRRDTLVRRKHEEAAAQQAPLAVTPARSWDEQRAQLASALSELDDDLATPIILHFLEGHSQMAIAGLLEVRQATVSRRIDRGLHSLQKRLGRARVVLSLGALAEALAAQRAAPAPHAVLDAVPEIALVAASEVARASLAAPLAALAASATALVAALTLAFARDDADAAPPPSTMVAASAPPTAAASAAEDRATAQRLVWRFGPSRWMRMIEEVRLPDPELAGRDVWARLKALVDQRQRGLSGAEWATLLSATDRDWLTGQWRHYQDFPGDPRLRELHPGPDGSPPIAVPVGDLLRDGTGLVDDPLADGGEALFFAQTEDRATAEIDLPAGRYEVVLGILGTDHLHDAIRVELGGQHLRVWGGWGDYGHFSEVPTIVTAPRDGSYDLHLQATEELGVSVGTIHLIPLDAAGDEGQVLRCNG